MTGSQQSARTSGKAASGKAAAGGPARARGSGGKAAAVAAATPEGAFPAPDHDHGRCASDAMALAEQLCARRGERLTPIRRTILSALLASHKPVGAYEIIDRVAEGGGRPAPITVYRALDFLREQGLVHRIESRNAFLACVHPHEDGEFAVFLICESCGAVGEGSGRDVAEALKASARAAGFAPRNPVIEIGGICAHCRNV
ncbi:MAG TPA: transcriptional repressor [Xanthobacteraceae bacterium]|nr:transcriptional repressor [Xanthobacteraceae bacterium]